MAIDWSQPLQVHIWGEIEFKTEPTDVLKVEKLTDSHYEVYFNVGSETVSLTAFSNGDIEWNKGQIIGTVRNESEFAYLSTPVYPRIKTASGNTISVQLKSQSEKIIFTNVKNTFTEDNMFCILLEEPRHDGFNLIKYPLINVFRVLEHYE
jgi:hypothetical protein